MRDRDAYLREGRNDPTSPQQRGEHPYDFVSLPDRPALHAGVGHDRFSADRWSGQLLLTYRTESPLFVGSGVFETAADCGLQGGSRPVRGMVRSAGRPVLPGSSWKGAVRARFEAITRSRIALYGQAMNEPEFKVPKVFLKPGDRKVRFKITDPRVGALRGPRIIRRAEDLRQLSPAESLFGWMGYRGRVRPGDGVIEGPAASEPLAVAALDSPQMHRLAQPGKAERRDREVLLSRIEGRKFYYDGEILHSRTMELRDGRSKQVWEPVDAVPAGSTIRLPVFVQSMTESELGALLLSAGHGTEVGIVRFGGYKSCGLGKVRCLEVEATLRRGAGGRRWRASRETGPDLQQAIAEARQTLIDTAALAELHQITTRTR